MEFNKKVVDLGLLYELACEMGGENALAETICVLAMDDVPMSDAVIKLGIVLDVLLPGYRNDWSKEMDD